MTEHETSRDEGVGRVYDESLAVILKIKAAWESGYTLVPLLGAGISIESGMPVVDEIMRYLVMIKKYIEHAAYRPRYPHSLYSQLDDAYIKQPIQFIQDYGWPDRFQLRHELLLWFEENRGTSTVGDHDSFQGWIQEGLEGEVSSFKKWQAETYTKLLLEVRGLQSDLDISDAAEAVPRGLRDRIATLQKQLKQNNPWSMLGEWKAVIREFTAFNADEADALFERLYRWHKPGRSHHFWALLTRLMGLRLFLTTNFDPFLESALRDQDIEHRVFGVERGDHLPHASLVREAVSVIKMHGDTHQLLLGEKLDHPPGKDYLQRLVDCMPRKPMLLVMGCGGNDPRILQIVRHLAERQGSDLIPGAIWLHFETFKKDAEKPLFTELNRVGKPRKIQHARVSNPGLFLSHLYVALRSQYPASRVPYQALPAQQLGAVPSPADAEEREAAQIRHHQNATKTVHVFSVEARDKSVASLRTSASLALDHFVSEKKGSGYSPVWIHLEAHYSVTGVVQQIVEQCRAHDTFLAPFVVGDLETEGHVELAVERILHVLRRGRYVLAFVALETFPWSPAAHHGVTATSDIDELAALLRLIARLMTKMDAQASDVAPALDVLVCASFDVPRERRGMEPNRGVASQLESLLYAVFGSARPLRLIPTKTPASSLTVSMELSEDLELKALSCFRRSRSLAFLRSLFGSLRGFDAARVDMRLAELVAEGVLVPADGGVFVMVHARRDELYAAFSEGTDSRAIIELLVGRGNEAECLAPIERCCALAMIHEKIATCCYFDAYLASLDASIFLEYFYHRVSSVKYFTRAMVLLAELGKRGDVSRTFELVMPLPGRDLDTREYSHREVLDYVSTARVEQLRTLKRALAQARDPLMRGLPAAQLEAWCFRVLRDNFYFPDTTRLEHRPSSMEVAHYLGSQSVEEHEASELVREIFCMLVELWRRSKYEQGRGAETAEKIQRVLSQPPILGGDWETGIATIYKLPREAEQQGSELKRVLDVLASLGQSERVVGAEDVLRHYVEEVQPATLLERQNRLRALCMSVECRSAPDASRRFSDVLDRNDALRVEHEQLARKVARGVEWCRALSPEDVRESSHDAFHLRFRTRLLVAEARLKWTGAVSHASFREADRLLEMARAGVSPDDHKRLALVELTWAEGLLLQASHSLRPAAEREDGDVVRGTEMDSAYVDYLRAGDALQRAREHLAQGSRGIDLWARYYQLWSQYQAEWCLFSLSALEAKVSCTATTAEVSGKRYESMQKLAKDVPRDMAALLKRIRRGLNAIQAGATMDPSGALSPRLQRTWLEMLCAGMVFGLGTVAATSCYEELSRAPATSWLLGIASNWDHWVLMNRRAGIPATVGSDSFFAVRLVHVGLGEPERNGDWRARVVEKLAACHGQEGAAISQLRARSLELSDLLMTASPELFHETLTALLLRIVQDPCSSLARSEASGTS